jgi:hypothetical protein
MRCFPLPGTVRPVNTENWTTRRIVGSPPVTVARSHPEEIRTQPLNGPDEVRTILDFNPASNRNYRSTARLTREFSRPTSRPNAFDTAIAWEPSYR